MLATVGTTSTSAIDPVRALGEVCRDEGIWLHVDAAYAGVAAVCPELRWLNDGLELADSYATNPHKWLLTNFDCDAFWVADPDALVGALSVLPEFLRNAPTESGAVIDYRDWQVPLGRRFRALKLWAVLRWYGAEGLREHIRTGVALAQELASWARADPRFEVVAPHPLALVCLRLVAGDEASETLLTGGQRVGRGVPVAHPGARPVRAAGLDRGDVHRAPARRGALGPAAAAGSGRLTPGRGRYPRAASMIASSTGRPSCSARRVASRTRL